MYIIDDDCKLPFSIEVLEFHLQDLFDDYEIIYLSLSGSILHGSETPDSDIDIRGIFLPKKEDLFLKKSKDYVKKDIMIKNHKIDFSIQSVQEFLNKLGSMECNSVELLFSMPTKCSLYKTMHAQYIYDKREEFLRRDISSFKGMASANIKRQGSSRSHNVKRTAKEVAHGIRTIQEAKELIDSLEIKFPLENKDYIKEIKDGKHEPRTICKEIAKELENLDNEKDPLTHKMKKAMDDTILAFYCLEDDSEDDY